MSAKIEEKLDTMIKLLSELVDSLPRKWKRRDQNQPYTLKYDVLVTHNKLDPNKEFYSATELVELYKETELTKIMINKVLTRKGYIKTGYKINNKRLALNLNYKEH